MLFALRSYWRFVVNREKSRIGSGSKAIKETRYGDQFSNAGQVVRNDATTNNSDDDLQKKVTNLNAFHIWTDVDDLVCISAVMAWLGSSCHKHFSPAGGAIFSNLSFFKSINLQACNHLTWVYLLFTFTGFFVVAKITLADLKTKYIIMNLFIQSEFSWCNKCC